ncbi:MAG: RDD family protein [Betaproteobacteria bacterium]|nr:MAG: RDD family protein [Betaproteobacteria bacterium]
MAANEQRTSMVLALVSARILAAVADGLVLLIVVALLPQPISVLLALSLFVAYHTILIYLMQQTLGKALFGLKVVRLTKEKPGLLWAFGRASFGYLIVDVMGLGFFAALFNQRHRALHDYVFGSVVAYSDAGRWSLRTFSNRLVEFAEKQLSAVNERKKTIGVLGAFWGFWVGIGRWLQNLVNPGAQAPSVAQTVAQAAWTNVVTPVALAAVAAVGVAVATMPQLRGVAGWLTTERYFIGDPRVVSEFDAGAEGWKIYGDAQGSSEEPDLEDGALRATDDAAGDVWYWEAPASFLGDKGHLYDLDLVYRLRTDVPNAPFNAADILIAGADITLVHDTWRNPGAEWTGYRIRLAETTNWINQSTNKPATREEFERVLSDMKMLRIRGEYASGRDTGWLDEVAIGAQPHANLQKIESPDSVIRNGPRGDLSVTLTGKPRFPVEMIFRPRTCPPGYNCRSLAMHYAEAPDARKLEGKEWVWCWGSAREDWLMDYEILVVDAEGTQLSAPVPVKCLGKD